jgi:hypothetical protein
MTERFYIVWFHKTPQGFRNTLTGDSGYYVKYKDKCSDEFSKNYILAKRYKAIGSAITRCSQGRAASDKAIAKDIVKIFENNHYVMRQIKLSRILNTNKPIDYNIKDDIFENARIDVVEIDEGNIRFLG